MPSRLAKKYTAHSYILNTEEYMDPSLWHKLYYLVMLHNAYYSNSNSQTACHHTETRTPPILIPHNHTIHPIFPLLLPLKLLSPNLIPERIPSPLRALLLEVPINRAIRQTAEPVTVPTRPLGHISVLVNRPCTPGIKLDTMVLTPLLPAGIPMSTPAHHIPETNPPCLAIPQEASHEHQRNKAKHNRQRNSQGLALRQVDVVLGCQPLLGEVEPQPRGVGLLGAALLVGQQGEGDVVVVEALEVAGFDLEGPEAPGGGHAVEVGDVLEGFGGVVEPVEADGDFVGDVVFGLVVEVGVPGDWGC